MSHRPRLAAIAALFLLLAGPLLARPLPLCASVPPVAALAQAVGGDAVRVHSLLRPGDNPVTFSPTPRQMTRLADSRAFVRIGLPFETAWLPRIQAVNPGMRIIDLRQDIDHLLAHHHTHAGREDVDHDTPDPHLWTDPLLLIRMSETLREALSRLDPAHADDYRRRQARLARRLRALHRELRDRLAPLKGRAFLVFHPAWGYFARRYGLRQLAIQHQGKQGGARWMASLIAEARRAHIHLVLVQPQFDRRLARRIAHAIDGRVVAIDPLARDYQGALRRLADTLLEDRP